MVVAVVSLIVVVVVVMIDESNVDFTVLYSLLSLVFHLDTPGIGTRVTTAWPTSYPFPAIHLKLPTPRLTAPVAAPVAVLYKPLETRQIIPGCLLGSEIETKIKKLKYF